MQYGAAFFLGAVGGAGLASMSLGVFLVLASVLGVIFLLSQATAVRLLILALYLGASGLGFYFVVVSLWS